MSFSQSGEHHPDQNTYYVIKNVIEFPLFPFQFFGETVNGYKVYVKCAHTTLLIYINDTLVFWSKFESNPPTYQSVVAHTQQWFHWPEEIESEESEAVYI